MALNSFKFIAFLVPLFALLAAFNAVKNKKAAGRLQLAVLWLFSWFTVCYSDIRFGFCAVAITLTAYICGLMTQRYRAHGRLITASAIVICAGFLGYFKYCNFFINSFAALFGQDETALNIILPVGISFYTFTALSYIIDIYRNKYVAEKNLFSFSLFIVFFPKLTAGPIIRGDEFLPQVRNYKGITLKNFQTGIQIFAFGLFKKIVLADHLGVFVNDVFSAPSAFNTGTVLLAVLSYSMQIYFDFSGYSDMAVGISKMAGFDLSANFNLPYISENPSEFWKRWHISLSSWFRDYLYIPLGGNRKGETRTYINLFIVMTVSGLWHGANFTFIAWGMLYGFAGCIHRALRKFRPKSGGSVAKLCRIVLMFVTTSLFWVVFRAESLSGAADVFGSLFSVHTGISQPYTWSFFAAACLIASASAAYIKQKNEKHINGFYPIMNLNRFIPLVIFFTFIGLTVIMGYFGDTAFIYGEF